MKKNFIRVSLGIILIGGLAFAQNASAATIMLRMYNPNSGEHHYTASISEKDNLVRLGWNFEGTAWIAPDTGDNVYRLYNPNSGDHHYTMSWSETTFLTTLGWNYEGVGWYSSTGKEVSLLRLFNPNEVVGTHHYTISNTEKNNLVGLGWNFEGIGWYGISNINPTQVDKTELQQLVNSTSSIILLDYTLSSWKGYNLALINANDILQDTTATQTQVDDAVVQLKSGIDGLVKVQEDVNKHNLLAVLSQVLQLNPLEFTDESWATLQVVVEDAYSVRNNEGATQTEVDATIISVENAIKNLEKRI